MGQLVAPVLTKVVSACDSLPQSPGLRVLLSDAGWGAPLSWDWEWGFPGRDANPGGRRLGDTGSWRRLRVCPDATCFGAGPGTPMGQVPWGCRAEVGTAAFCGEWLLDKPGEQVPQRCGCLEGLAAQECTSLYRLAWVCSGHGVAMGWAGAGGSWGEEGSPGCRWAAPPERSQGCTHWDSRQPPEQRPPQPRGGPIAVPSGGGGAC